MRILFFGDGDWATAALRSLMVKHEIIGVVFRCQPTTDRFSSFVSDCSLPQYAPARVNSASFREEVLLEHGYSWEDIIRLKDGGVIA